MDFIAKSLISNKTLAINMICFVHSVHLAKWLKPSEYFYCNIVDYHVKTSCFLDFDAKFFWYMINLKMSHTELWLPIYKAFYLHHLYYWIGQLEFANKCLFTKMPSVNETDICVIYMFISISWVRSIYRVSIYSRRSLVLKLLFKTKHRPLSDCHWWEIFKVEWSYHSLHRVVRPGWRELQRILEI